MMMKDHSITYPAGPAKLSFSSVYKEYLVDADFDAKSVL